MTAQGLQLLGHLRDTLYPTLGGLGPLEPPVVLLDFPNHGNVGDSAIWRGEVTWLRQTVGASRFVCEIANYCNEQLRAVLKDAGTILLHGGGNLGDLWPTHQVFRERILDEFPDRRVIQLPQSIQFQSDGILRRRARRLAGTSGSRCWFASNAASRSPAAIFSATSGCVQTWPSRCPPSRALPRRTDPGPGEDGHGIAAGPTVGISRRLTGCETRRRLPSRSNGARDIGRLGGVFASASTIGWRLSGCAAAVRCSGAPGRSCPIVSTRTSCVC